MSEVRQQVTQYVVSAMPVDGCIDYWAWDVNVEWRGDGKWAVVRHSQCLSDQGEWDYESIPSERRDDWLEHHRFTEQEALRLAREIAPNIVVNGHTIESVLARRTSDDAASQGSDSTEGGGSDG